MTCSESTRRLRRILWIDDELRPDDALLCLLAGEAIHVEVAASAAEGLAKAISREYDAIVVDLKLPDMFGLTVLQRLTEKLSVPVFVATGYYVESEIEMEAMRLGAAAFLRKPLLGPEDLLAVLSNEVHRGRANAPALQRHAESVPEMSSVSVQSLCIQLDNCVSRRAQFGVLLRALLDRRVPLPLFIGCAAALRALATSPSSHTLPTSNLRNAIDDESRHPLPSNAKLLAALCEVEHSGVKQAERALATRFRLSRAYFSRLMLAQTGRRYHDWMRFAVMRTVLRKVLENREHVSQIAYCAGYQTLSHFDHDFGTTFGVAPTELRDLCFRWLSPPTVNC